MGRKSKTYGSMTRSFWAGATLGRPPNSTIRYSVRELGPNQTAVAGGAVADQSDTKVCIFSQGRPMLFFPRSRQVVAAFGITLALAGGAYYCATLHRTMAPSDCGKREDRSSDWLAAVW